MVFAWIVNGLALLVIAGASLWMVRQRQRTQRARRTARDLVISSMSGLVMGAMLLGFQKFYQPQVRHLITEGMKDESLEDESSGDPPPGGRLLHQQLERIRRGEEAGELTARTERRGLLGGPDRRSAPARCRDQPAMGCSASSDSWSETT